MDDERPDFSNQLMWVAFVGMSGGHGGVLLEHVVLKHYLGRMFIVGSVTHKERYGWVADGTAAVAWESIAHYRIFRSHEHYEQRTMSPLSKWIKSMIRRRSPYR